MMLKIGITGNIGSGKTTISKIFELLGVPVFFADDAAKQVMTSDTLLMDEISQAFGGNSYFDDGTLNRKHIAAIVFNDELQLKRLNEIVHPAVFRAFDQWVAGKMDVPYVLKEAALLFESDSYKICDKTILVTAPLELRIKRVIDRDGLSRNEILNRESKQFTEEKKKALADFSIKNDDSELVIPQVLQLHEVIKSLAARH